MNKKKHPLTKKICTILIRVNPKEYLIIKSKADKKTGGNISKLIRDSILKTKVDTDN